MWNCRLRYHYVRFPLYDTRHQMLEKFSFLTNNLMQKWLEILCVIARIWTSSRKHSFISSIQHVPDNITGLRETKYYMSYKNLNQVQNTVDVSSRYTSVHLLHWLLSDVKLSNPQKIIILLVNPTHRIQRWQFVTDTMVLQWYREQHHCRIVNRFLHSLMYDIVRWYNAVMQTTFTWFAIQHLAR